MVKSILIIKTKSGNSPKKLNFIFSSEIYINPRSSKKWFGKTLVGNKSKEIGMRQDRRKKKRAHLIELSNALLPFHIHRLGIP